MKEILLDLVFPKTCINCAHIGNYICSGCIDKYFVFRKAQECHVCKTPVSNGFVHLQCRSKTRLDGVVICVNYNKLVERLIAKYKYSFYHDISNFLVHFYLNAIDVFASQMIEAVVPVPLHPKKERIRGFNQAKLISKLLSKSLSLEVAYIAQRVRFTHSQVGLTREKRLTNLREAFGFCSERPYKRVLLLDDVMTTGATLEECAKVLKENGVAQVFAIVFSRG